MCDSGSTQDPAHPGAVPGCLGRPPQFLPSGGCATTRGPPCPAPSPSASRIAPPPPRVDGGARGQRGALGGAGPDLPTRGQREPRNWGRRATPAPCTPPSTTLHPLFIPHPSTHSPAPALRVPPLHPAPLHPVLHPPLSTQTSTLHLFPLPFPPHSTTPLPPPHPPRPFFPPTRGQHPWVPSAQHGHPSVPQFPQRAHHTNPHR